MSEQDPPSPGPLLPERRVWRALANELDTGHPVVLAVVVEHTGSSPGRTGWVMAVGRDGWLAGTTGGGVAEVAVVAAAVGQLGGATSDPPTPRATLLTQTHRPGAEHASELLCGGDQELALVVLDHRVAPGLAALDAALGRGDTFAWTVSADGWSPGGDGTGFRNGVTSADAVSFTGSPTWRYSHISGPTHLVVLVGAGHVGSALAAVLVPLGFRVRVVDERPGAVARLAGLAHDLLPCPYEALADAVPPGQRTYVVVATHAPERDAVAVAALRAVRLGYLGMIGSPGKLASLVDPPPLELPMGVPIGSHTPEEIAVSVAARLVATRNLVPGARSAHAPRPLT